VPVQACRFRRLGLPSIAWSRNDGFQPRRIADSGQAQNFALKQVGVPAAELALLRREGVIL